MKKLITLCAIATGCATHAPEPVKPSTPDPKVQISQNADRGHLEYVACAEGRCPDRSTKVIALEPKPAQRVEPVTAPAPARPSSYRVHFAWGSSRLSDEARDQIQAATKAARPATRVVIRGGTDPTGGMRANHRLALKRAEVVKHALISAGIPASRIDATRHTPCCSGSFESDREQRRADVEIHIFTDQAK